MQITVKNTAGKPITLEGFSMLYVYARSAENLRDHRHVTSLLQRVSANRYGLLYKPTMVFNEKGHCLNTTGYFVYGCLHQGKKKYLPQRKISDFNYLVSGKGSIAAAKMLAERVLNTRKDVITQGVENAAVLVFPRITLKRLTRLGDRSPRSKKGTFSRRSRRVPTATRRRSKPGIG